MVLEGISVPGVHCGGRSELTEVAAASNRKIPNLPYRYRMHTEFIEESGTDMGKIPNLQKCRVPVSKAHRPNTRTPGIAVGGMMVPGVYWGGCTKPTELSGICIELYRTILGCSVGYRGRTELIPVPPVLGSRVTPESPRLKNGTLCRPRAEALA